MRKNNILILLIGVFAMLFTSCRTGESLTYFQNADEVGESIRNVDYAIEIVPAISPGISPSTKPLIVSSGTPP